MLLFFNRNKDKKRKFNKKKRILAYIVLAGNLLFEIKLYDIKNDTNQSIYQEIILNEQNQSFGYLEPNLL